MSLSAVAIKNAVFNRDQQENHVQIPTTCSHVLFSGSGEELDLPFAFKLS
jgi:hypothetical protein